MRSGRRKACQTGTWGAWGISPTCRLSDGIRDCCGGTAELSGAVETCEWPRSTRPEIRLADVNRNDFRDVGVVDKVTSECGVDVSRRTIPIVFREN